MPSKTFVALVDDDLVLYKYLKNRFQDIRLIAGNIRIGESCERLGITYGFEESYESRTQLHSVFGARLETLLRNVEAQLTDLFPDIIGLSRWLERPISETLSYNNINNLSAHCDRLLRLTSPGDEIYIAESNLPAFYSNSSDEARRFYGQYFSNQRRKYIAVKHTHRYSGYSLNGLVLRSIPPQVSNFAVPVYASIGPTFKFKQQKLEQMFEGVNFVTLQNLVYENSYNLGKVCNWVLSSSSHDNTTYATICNFRERLAYALNRLRHLIYEIFKSEDCIQPDEKSVGHFIKFFETQVNTYYSLDSECKEFGLSAVIVNELDGGLNGLLCSLALKHQRPIYVLPEHETPGDAGINLATALSSATLLGLTPDAHQKPFMIRRDDLLTFQKQKKWRFGEGFGSSDAFVGTEPSKDACQNLGLFSIEAEMFKSVGSGGMSDRETFLRSLNSVFDRNQRGNGVALIALNTADMFYIPVVNSRRLLDHICAVVRELSECNFKVILKQKPGHKVAQFFYSRGVEARTFLESNVRVVDDLPADEVEAVKFAYFPFGPSTYVQAFRHLPYGYLLVSPYMPTSEYSPKLSCGVGTNVIFVAPHELELFLDFRKRPRNTPS